MEEGEAVREEGVIPADDIDEAPDMESRIKEAMRDRVPHFKEQADSLTFEGVRRLIEKDLGLETHALDEHRRFIKQLLLQCLEGGDNDNDNASKNSGETVHNSMSSNKEEVPELSDEPESKTKAKGNSSENEKLECSPAVGSLSGKKKLSHDNGKKEGITQIVIKKAIMKRGAYFRANSEKITMSGVRRLLEEDLELEKYSLDSHKKSISEQLELVLQSPEVSESATAVKKKPVKKSTRGWRSGDDEGNSVPSDDENEYVEDKEKPSKKITKRRMQTLEGVKKRKVPPAKEPKMSRKKRVNPKEEAADDDSESGDGKGESASDESPSSPERLKKEVSTPVYGKHVEHLKSIIKSCGMSVPPAIYKKVKQISESKRETHLIKELEGILSKEGLSTNPSEKEIKEVRKKKERAKELEGIDTSNIVSSSRRRTASRFLPPPKPKEPVEEEDSDDKDGNEDDDEDDEEEDDENDDGNEDSQSEDQSEDQEDSD